MATNSENDSDNKKPKDVNIGVPFTNLGFTGFPPTVWITGNFSRPWYEDAKREASVSDNIHAKRREILFSVCFLETYLFEWVRDLVGLGAINDYFPYIKPPQGNSKRKRYRRPLRDNWKKLPEELFSESKIGVDPQLDTSNLGNLIDYRDDLVHAHVSRPVSSSQPNDLNPRTSPADIDGLSPGWARDIAKNLILDLHRALGTPPPTYL